MDDKRPDRAPDFLLDPDGLDDATDEDLQLAVDALNARMNEKRKALGLPPLED